MSFHNPKLERDRAYHAERRAQSQDVYLQYKDVLDRGPADPKRRARSEQDFIQFCKTYGGQAFYLPWSDYHIKAARKIESAARDAGLFALAMPRGSGKSSLCHWATLWVTLCGISAYTVFIGATEAAAARRLENLKQTLRFNDLLFADFPDVCCPIRFLQGEARRAVGQKFDGKPTGIQWKQKQIVLASVDLPYAKASEAIIDVTGIEGEIRGRSYERQDGKVVRPQFVVVDDPQTRESARSVSQSQNRENIISGDVKYLSGPDAAVGIVMPCTVIFQGDAADRMLNQKTHPDWRGERVKFMESFPSRLDLWEQYGEIRAEGFRSTGDATAANDFYKANRKDMDVGAVVTWEHRYNPDEISAIQHAMNQKLRDEAAFMAEYQNEPTESTEDLVITLTSDEIAERASGVKRGIVPDECETVTAFIDVSQKVLWWTVCAWSKNFTGSIIDYGVFPEQGLKYVTLATVRKTLKQAAPGAGLEGSIYKGLGKLTGQILDREYRSESGTIHRVKLCLIDSGWGATSDTIYRFCRRSKLANILLPSKGVGITAARAPLVDPTQKRKPGENVHGQWKVSRTTAGVKLVTYDTNHWKGLVNNRLAVSIGDPGALTLFEASPYQHRSIADQLSSEVCIRTEGRGRVVDQWQLKPGRDNHYFDCVVGCAVAASMNGSKVVNEVRPKPKEKNEQPKSKRRKVIYL